MYGIEKRRSSLHLFSWTRWSHFLFAWNPFNSKQSQWVSQFKITVRPRKLNANFFSKAIPIEQNSSKNICPARFPHSLNYLQKRIHSERTSLQNAFSKTLNTKVHSISSLPRKNWKSKMAVSTALTSNATAKRLPYLRLQTVAVHSNQLWFKRFLRWLSKHDNVSRFICQSQQHHKWN